MKIVIDTENLNSAIEFGELIRNWAFTGKGYGCYSNFNLRPELKKISPTNEIIKAVLGEQPAPDNDYGYCEDLKNLNAYSDGTNIVAWHWYGDGCLYVSDGKRAAINHDCKKDYCWDWV